MKTTETIILILVILIESIIFLSINKREENQRDYKDEKLMEFSKQKVDSMRVRNTDYFLLTLKLNNIVENNRTTRRRKLKDGRIIDLMLRVGE